MAEPVSAGYEPCVYCGSGDVSLDCAISLLGKFESDVTVCRGCGLLFVNPPLSTAQIACLYDRDYWGSPRVGIRKARRTYRRQYRLGAAYGRKLARLAPTGRMLEVGCGLAFFLSGVADHCGWEVEGVDAAEGVSEFARGKLGLRVREAMFDGNSFPAAAFDLVRAKDVLEHTSSPVAFLEGIHRVLRPGGLVELWLPNGPLDLAPARRAFRRGQRAQMAAGHLLFISPRLLRRMVSSAGFAVARTEVFGFRAALRAIGGLPAGRRPSRHVAPPAREGPLLSEWERPPREQGLKGTTLYARLRAWRSHHPSLPAWLPLGFRQRMIARKP